MFGKAGVYYRTVVLLKKVIQVFAYIFSSLGGGLYALHAHSNHLRLLRGELGEQSAARTFVRVTLTRFVLLASIAWLVLRFPVDSPIPLALCFVIGYACTTAWCLRR